MTEQEKKLIVELLTDMVKCSTDTVYESFAILFEGMSKHPELNLQEVLTGMAFALRQAVREK